MNNQQLKTTFRHESLSDTKEETQDILLFIEECILTGQFEAVFQMYAIINWFEYASSTERKEVIDKMLNVHFLATIAITGEKHGIS